MGTRSEIKALEDKPPNALDVTFSFEKLCVEIPKMLQDAQQLLSAMFGLYCFFVHSNLGACPKTILAYCFALKS